MGKGDKKTKRGKIHIGTHGVVRPKKTAKVSAAKAASEKAAKAAK